nr:MAG: hypothetical protein DIU70_01875 [Bacillota bacterium]
MLPLLVIAAAVAGCTAKPGPAQPPSQTSPPGADSTPAPTDGGQQAPPVDPAAVRLGDLLRQGPVRVSVMDLGLERDLSPAEREQAAAAVRTAVPVPDGAGAPGGTQSPLPWDLTLTVTRDGGSYTLGWFEPTRFWLRADGEGEPSQEMPGAFSQEDSGLYRSLLATLGPELPLPPDEAQRIIEDRARAAVEALRDRNWEALASLVHPTRGVRFSPYGYVRVGPEGDRVLTPAELPKAWTDKTVHLWGHYDGSGEPIRLTFAGYFERFVYDKDFAEAPQVGYNRILGRGNTLQNWWQVYPGGILVEYHFPGTDPRYQGMDWRSLRLIFVEESGTWYLVGIIHDEWTT